MQVTFSISIIIQKKVRIHYLKLRHLIYESSSHSTANLKSKDSKLVYHQIHKKRWKEGTHWSLQRKIKDTRAFKLL